VHRSAVILLFELVVGAVSSLLLTDEVILLREWLGGGLIVIAAYVAAHIHARSEA
jgi:drug/metabolite transporter (DMT)-like permease